MAFHRAINRMLLLGVRPEPMEPLAAAHSPEALRPLIEAITPEHRKFDARALYYADRYRSGFWSIFLLSAVAVACAAAALLSEVRQPELADVLAVIEVVLIVTIIVIYWRGIRNDWHGQWLEARTRAELVWYLPMLAPLIDFSVPNPEPNWYVRAFNPGQHLRSVNEIATLCARIEPLARALSADIWSDQVFVSGYARWTMNILEQQRRYHNGVSAKQSALLRRVHAINASLFVLTAVAAMIHLVADVKGVSGLRWLALVTTFFPALGASLQGVLAQSEAYRLAATSQRLVVELREATERIHSELEQASSREGYKALKASIEGAIALILEEHQDWNLLVRPHRLSLA